MSAVWVATDLYPESSKVIVAESRDAILRAMVRDIGRDEYEGFTATLQGDQATDVTFDGDPTAVLEVWAGEFMPLDDPGADGFVVGEDWRVEVMEVQR